MGLLVLSILLSIIAGSIAWLIVGSRLPLDDDDKWPIPTHIFIYAIGLFLPIYLTIFFLN